LTAIVVLGMHRSGTSCLAGMLAEGGVASAGDAVVRNWDNARGHHELRELIRLDEAVLAHSGGHWLAPPREVRWTDAHARERDELLRAPLRLLKDPRMLLVLPFWRASRAAMRTIAIVRHPLAVARSLEAWRQIPLSEGLALWTAHNRALAADRAQHGYPIVDFDQPANELAAACAALAPGGDFAAGHDERLVHHDAAEPPALPELAEALALYRELSPRAAAARPPFPRAEMQRFARSLSLTDARAAVAAVADAAAVIVPAVTLLLRHHAHAEALALLDGAALDPDLAALLRGKVLLAGGDAAGALPHLAAASALYQARALLPHALRATGRAQEARLALRELAGVALYPHQPLATLAEWSWLDGDRDGALAEMADAIAAAPDHRRGRLRTRRAEWLLAQGEPAQARSELERALIEDPGYARSREVLDRVSVAACGFTRS
jgi:hypothetical protein